MVFISLSVFAYYGAALFYLQKPYISQHYITHCLNLVLRMGGAEICYIDAFGVIRGICRWFVYSSF